LKGNEKKRLEEEAETKIVEAQGRTTKRRDGNCSAAWHKEKPPPKNRDKVKKSRNRDMKVYLTVLIGKTSCKCKRSIPSG